MEYIESPPPFYARSIKNRIFSIHGTIPDCTDPEYKFVDEFLWHVLALDQKNPGEPMVWVVESNGGSSDTFWTIYDTMQLLYSPVYTIARTVASGGALLTMAGAKGHRYIFPHTYITLHGVQVSCMDGSHPHDKLTTLTQYNTDIASLLDRHSGGKILTVLDPKAASLKRSTRIKKINEILLDKDRVFSAKEAVRYGIADHIIDQSTFQKLLTLE